MRRKNFENIGKVAVNDITLCDTEIGLFIPIEKMSQNIKEETIRLLFHVRVEQKVEREQVANVTGTNKDDSVQKGPVKRDTAKVYPNDPCPCGSGKKYKQCCGRN